MSRKSILFMLKICFTEYEEKTQVGRFSASKYNIKPNAANIIIVYPVPNNINLGLSG